MNATISVARSLAELRRLRDAWDGLASVQANPFLCFSWHDRWLEYFGPSFEVWALVVRKAAVVIAICPWGIRRARPFGERKLTWLGHDGVTPTCLDILVAPDEWTSAKPLLSRELTSSREFDRWDFARVAQGGYAAELLLTVPYIAVSPDLACPVTVLPVSSDAYFRTVSSGLRKQLKHKHARLAAEGSLSYERCTTAHDVDRVFPDLVRLNQQRMASKHVAGGFLDPVFTRFHASLVADLADQGLVRFDVLRLDGRAVAATYCIGSGLYWFGYQSGFDPAYQTFSPMTVLDGIRLRSLIEETGVKLYDWGPGLDPYKRRFSNDEKRFYRVRGVQRTTAGIVWSTLFRTRRRLRLLLTRIRHSFRCELEDVVMFGALDALKRETPSGCESVRLIVPADVEMMRASLGKTRWRELAQRMPGSWGVAAWDQNGLLGYAWATNLPRTREGEHPFLYSVTPPEETVYLYDFHVFPFARSRGIATRIVSALIGHAVFLGYRYAYLTHAAENRPLVTLSKRLGLREVGRIRFSRNWWRSRTDTSALERIAEHRYKADRNSQPITPS